MGSCTHEPFSSDDDLILVDTTSTSVDTSSTNPVDTSSSSQACDPDVVYFQQQLLPILQSNCAISACHDAASAQDGVILDSYINVLTTGEIVAGDLSESDLYEVLVEDKEEKRMPPSPRARLNQEQIKLIGDWILQGAKDLTCDSNTNDEGKSTNVTYATTIAPVITDFCLGCHSGTTPSGGVSLSGHQNVKKAADAGTLIGSITWQDAYAPMPKGASKLSACIIDQFKAWVDAGALDN